MVDDSESVSLDELRAQCQALETVVLRAQLMPAEELATHKPEALNNPQTGARGWLRYLIVLQRAHSVLERTRRPSAPDPNDITRLRALAGRPETVSLIGVSSEGPTAVQVYPKSADALLELHGRNLRLGFLTSWRDELRRLEGTAKVLDLLLVVEEEILFQHKLCVWGVTTPGARLPWDSSIARPPASAFPAWMQDLAPEDFYRIDAAYQQVNHHRLKAIEGLLAPESTGGAAQQRPSWSTFLGAAAVELGVRPEELMQDWSMASVIVAVTASGASKRAAAKAAQTAAEKRH